MGALVPPTPNHASVYPFRNPLVGLSAQEHKPVYFIPLVEMSFHPIRVLLSYFQLDNLHFGYLSLQSLESWCISMETLFVHILEEEKYNIILFPFLDPRAHSMSVRDPRIM